MDKSKSQTEQSKQATPCIPDQPRDCGPHVDTWPILDAETADPAGRQEKDKGRKAS